MRTDQTIEQGYFAAKNMTPLATMTAYERKHETHTVTTTSHKLSEPHRRPSAGTKKSEQAPVHKKDAAVKAG